MPHRSAADPRPSCRQEDTFFRVPAGRLKLRKLAPDRGELIFYRRPDQPGPKCSDYSISVTSEPDTLRDVLAAALGDAGVVIKERWLYLVDQTRIHLDRVERLGDFVELEVVLSPGQSAEEGQSIAADLMRAIGDPPAGPDRRCVPGPAAKAGGRGMNRVYGCLVTLTAFFVIFGLFILFMNVPESLPTVAIAGGLLLGGSLLLGVRSYRRQRLRDGRLERGLCFECGYDLRGSTGPEKPSAPDDPAHSMGQHRCPECGEPFDSFRI